MIEIKDKPKRVESALLVGVQYPSHTAEEVSSLLDELKALVETLGITVMHREVARIKGPKPRFLLGTGKVKEIIALAKERGCDCIVFDDDLTPGQQRNWERECDLYVIDRQEVILDIFAQRAQTKEAVLQVSLARMEYSLPRLKRAWSHLSRQHGGGITQRGEGEAQLEIDQRLVRSRISRLKRDLVKVVKHRTVQRKMRLQIPLSTAAIVGYTNAGKSSLLNRLTQAQVLAEARLFTTLDPTTRRLDLPSGQTLLLTDTVGFVRRLPHRLVEAFKATLEEVVVSEFLIQVLDVTSPAIDQHRRTIQEVLKELEVEEKRIVTVYNKIDLLDELQRDHLLKLNHGHACYLSAHTGMGLDTLITRLESMLEDAVTPIELMIPHHRYDLINRLHQFGCIKREAPLQEGVYISGNIPKRMTQQLTPFQIANGSHLLLPEHQHL